MKKNIIFICCILFITGQTVGVFGGVEWQAKTTTKANNKVTTITTKGYAQKGFVREDFVDSTGDNQGMQKGNYMIFDPVKNVVYMVDTNKKSYTEMSIDTMSQFAGSAGQIVQMKVSNAKVDVKKLVPEKALTYNCQHLSINMSYDMETKIAFMTTKGHIDQTNEIWGSNEVSKQDFSDAYMGKSFKTSFKELDEVITKQMEAYKNIGFVLKSNMTQKTTDQDNKIQTSTSEMTVESVSTKDLDNNLFKVPAGYKKNEIEKPKDTNIKDNGAKDKEKDKEINPGDVLKGFFK
jgi:hypothetical protein